MVSQDYFPHLLDQAGEALDFLETHEKELERLNALAVDHMAFDFRVPRADSAQPTHHWTSELIAAMARWQMELVFSVVETEESNRPTRRRFSSR